MDLNFILQNSAGNLYWKNRNGQYLGANHAFIMLAGYQKIDDLIGKTDRDLFSSAMSEQKLRLLEETDQRIIRSGIGEDLREEGVNTDGKPAFYITKKIPLRNQAGEITGLMGTSLDITKEMQADVARSEFLANMRHDIRTPLSGIVGFSEIIKSETKEPQIKEYAENLIASSNALKDFMNEVLEAIQVSSGEIPMLKRKFNLAQTFEQIVSIHAAKAAEKNLKLHLNISSELPHFVIGDKIRLHRIAMELVGNALNFTDDGHINIDVELAKDKNQILVIKLTVTDTGMGIPKDKQQDIYVQFKRLTPSYQGIYKGAGLGLYIVKQFIDELNGEIYVESDLHKGSCFTCLLPMQKALLDDDSGVDPDNENLKIEKQYMSALIQQPTPISEPRQNSNASIRVLVVEDNMAAQKVAKVIFSKLSCHVDVASSATEALFQCENNIYNIILMDIGLGKGSYCQIWCTTLGGLPV